MLKQAKHNDQSPGSGQSTQPCAGRTMSEELKPALQWSRQPPYHVAYVPGGHYSIERVDSNVTYFELKGLVWPAKKFGTIAEAKAFAQSDFDGRSAPPTHPQTTR